MKNTDATVEVAVEYQLQEYKQVLRELYPIYLATTGKKPDRLLPWNWPIVEESLFAVVAPIVFFYKKRRVGDCVFTFGEAGFSRTSESGTGQKTWDEVKIVHRLSAAYLIELKTGGAMPVPYRVFTPEQRELFEVFAQPVAT